MVKVVKRDGTTEPFQRKKIVNACVGAGAPADVAASIADEIKAAARDKMPTSEIRKIVLKKLGKVRPGLVKAYKQYEASKAKK